MAGIGSQDELSTGEQLAQMFSVNDLSEVDSNILSTTMSKWNEFWIYPAIMAGVIAVIFFAAFWDKISITSDDENSSE